MITGEDLQTPAGKLTDEILSFVQPDVESPEEAADVYADAANLKVSEWEDPVRTRQAAVAWAYYLVYDARAQQIMSSALSIGVDGEANRSNSVVQAQELRRWAKEELARFEALERLEFPAESTEEVRPPLRSRAVPTRARWP